jgi:hypothetical protein
MARPRKYATAAEKQAAFRERYAVKTFRIERETGETIAKIGEAFDASESEVIASLVKYALLNRDWFKLGLFGKRLPHASDKGRT